MALVGGDTQLVVDVGHGDDGLEDGALAVLNPLAHGVEVGGEVDGCGEDALVVLALALAVELLPPFCEVVESGVVVDENLDLLAGAVEGVACGGIYLGALVGTAEYGLLALACALHQGLDVVAGHGDGEQAHGGEHGEAAAHVVGDDVGLVAFLVGQRAECAALGVGDGHDALAAVSWPSGSLELLLEQAEGDGGLCGGAALADDDDAETLALQIGLQLGQVVLADVLAGEYDLRLGVAAVHVEGVAEGFEHGLGAEIAAADAYHYHHLALAAEALRGGVDVVDKGVADFAGEANPAEEVVACAVAFHEGVDAVAHF